MILSKSQKKWYLIYNSGAAINTTCAYYFTGKLGVIQSILWGVIAAIIFWVLAHMYGVVIQTRLRVRDQYYYICWYIIHIPIAALITLLLWLD